MYYHVKNYPFALSNECGLLQGQVLCEAPFSHSNILSSPLCVIIGISLNYVVFHEAGTVLTAILSNVHDHSIIDAVLHLRNLRYEKV